MAVLIILVIFKGFSSNRGYKSCFREYILLIALLESSEAGNKKIIVMIVTSALKPFMGIEYCFNNSLEE